MTAHCEQEHRNRERKREPEPGRHIDELGARPRLGGYGFRLQGHAADGTGSRVILPHLGMHRACPQRTRCDCDRSEEHTSELQSLMRISYAVFCLKTKKENHE